MSTCISLCYSSPAIGIHNENYTMQNNATVEPKEMRQSIV